MSRARLRSSARRGRFGWRVALLVTVVLSISCEVSMKLPPRGGEPESASARATPAGEGAKDLLGDKPSLPPARPFAPPPAQVFQTANGIRVWLVENHSLPLVAVSVVVPVGAASDPPGRSGLAHITADMLDEGAGERTAIELSTAINDLGATLYVGTAADGSYAGLSCLKKHFAKGFAILADVIARPTFREDEWKRTAGLWKNALRKRADDPNAVSSVVIYAAHHGPGTSYGRPTSGLLADSEKVTLDEVKAAYRATWRPDQAVFVVVGDVTRAEITEALDAELSEWKATGAPATTEVRTDPSHVPPRLVLVDRPGAPQSVIAVVRDGVKVTDPKAPMLDLVNNALGGSFTSRLNQNLREEKNWTYGARSGFSEVRGRGAFVARSAVETQFTGPALGEILKELDLMAKSGLSSEELAKVKAQDRADLVETYGTVGGVASRLGTLARLGLPATFDEQASRARQSATLGALAPLSKEHFDASRATIVIVGPSQEVLPQLAKMGLPAPEPWDEEGRPLESSAAPAAKGEPASPKPKAP